MVKYTFACRDMGMTCDFQVEDENRNALFGKILAHAKTVHNMQQIDSATKQKMNSVIKEQ